MRRRQQGAVAHTLSRGQSCTQLHILVKSSRLLPFIFQLAPETTQEPSLERRRQILAVRSQDGAVSLCLAGANWLTAITSPQRIFPLMARRQTYFSPGVVGQGWISVNDNCEGSDRPIVLVVSVCVDLVNEVPCWHFLLQLPCACI